MPQAETLSKPARKSKGHRGLFIAAGILALLIGAGAVWWRTLYVIPTVTIPMPTLPSPNAFDLFAQASDKIQEGKAVSDAVVTSPSAGTRVYTQAEKEAILAKNVSALKEFRTALPQEYLAPPLRSIGDIYPHFAKFRNMTRLLRFEGEVYAGRGDWGRAIQSDLDAMQLGITIPRGAALSGQLVGLACEAIGRAGAWKKVDHLSASEAKTAARRLEKMLAKRFSFADTVQEEKWSGQATLLELFRYPNWRTSSGLLDGDDDSFGAKLGRITNQAKLHLYTNETILNNYTRYMDSVSARSRQPYATMDSAPLPEPNDPVNEIIVPLFIGAGFKDLITQTLSDLLLVTLALQAYRQEHGAYPQRLDSLAPNYLSKLPNDPFGTQTFPYRGTGDKYLLYSVGPDKVDDGGRPIDDPSKASSTNPNARYSIQSDSKGDIVPRVNKY